jgi:hypothetical protein
MADFLQPREDSSDRISAKWSSSGHLPWITLGPQENDPIQIGIEWRFNFAFNPAPSVEMPQIHDKLLSGGFLSLNPVLRTADSLEMRQLPSVYTVYAALSIAVDPSVFGSALGPQIYFISTPGLSEFDPQDNSIWTGSILWMTVPSSHMTVQKFITIFSEWLILYGSNKVDNRRQW